MKNLKRFLALFLLAGLPTVSRAMDESDLEAEVREAYRNGRSRDIYPGDTYRDLMNRSLEEVISEEDERLLDKENKKLAREEVGQVIGNLATAGYERVQPVLDKIGGFIRYEETRTKELEEEKRAAERELVEQARDRRIRQQIDSEGLSDIFDRDAYFQRYLELNEVLKAAEIAAEEKQRRENDRSNLGFGDNQKAEYESLQASIQASIQAARKEEEMLAAARKEAELEKKRQEQEEQARLAATAGAGSSWFNPNRSWSDFGRYSSEALSNKFYGARDWTHENVLKPGYNLVAEPFNQMNAGYEQMKRNYNQLSWQERRAVDNAIRTLQAFSLFGGTAYAATAHARAVQAEREAYAKAHPFKYIPELEEYRKE